MFYLAGFPDHHSVGEQYALNWRLRYFSMIPAYCIVGFLSLYTISRLQKFSTFFAQPSNRLLLCWFLVAFILANHEVFIKPMQPLHFTRGYIWSSLFLLGIPAIHYLLSKSKNSLLGKFVMIISLLLFFSDNLFWVFSRATKEATGISVPYISHEQDQILRQLQPLSGPQTLIIGGDNAIPYFSTVYTSGYPWLSHPFTTPFVDKKRQALETFIRQGIIDSAWHNKSLIFVFRKNNPEELHRSDSMPFPTTLLIETPSYKILEAKENSRHTK
jgi:hypothetical protein